MRATIRKALNALDHNSMNNFYLSLLCTQDISFVLLLSVSVRVNHNKDDGTLLCIVYSNTSSYFEAKMQTSEVVGNEVTNPLPHYICNIFELLHIS